jgi:hypothetical protein
MLCNSTINWAVCSSAMYILGIYFCMSHVACLWSVWVFWLFIHVVYTFNLCFSFGIIHPGLGFINHGLGIGIIHPGLGIIHFAFVFLVYFIHPCIYIYFFHAYEVLQIPFPIFYTSYSYVIYTENVFFNYIWYYIYPVDSILGCICTEHITVLTSFFHSTRWINPLCVIHYLNTSGIEMVCSFLRGFFIHFSYGLFTLGFMLFYLVFDVYLSLICFFFRNL